ncbi:DEAD/DEAH box helicase [Paenibacillus sp. GCM10012303]|uniref:DEAD/DEAH box helicase n=1 Tax=Paenibacillus sp. GCM10012303 TaxID=3317340 RepID=UPI0036239E9E
MYDDYAKQIIEMLPPIPELDRDECRRVLSRAYFHILKSNIDATNDESSNHDMLFIRDYLRRLADTLESVAIFDSLNGLDIPRDIQNACAFVAAEALALLNEIPSDDKYVEDKVLEEEEENPRLDDQLFTDSNYIMIEAALLYMIGGYDINSVALAKRISISFDINFEGYQQIKYLYSGKILNLIKLLTLGNLRYEEEVDITIPPLPPYNKEMLVGNITEMYVELRIQFYQKLEIAVISYMEWLRGTDDGGLQQSKQILNRIRDASILKNKENSIGFTKLSDIYHLSSLLLTMIDRTCERSVVHVTPEPDGASTSYLDSFKRYLRNRAGGTELLKGRPFLWPSSMEYIKDCLPGPYRDSVVSMPTGSGKSFVAELAISHSLCRGWVLYIAPTNALAYQIRRDLSSSLSSFEDVRIRAFVGGAEYTTLEETKLEEENFVVVMTPEKCALALRLYPEMFASCSLCIFDECHLLNDSNRGVTSDIILAQLFNSSKNIRFLLMSAMVSNPKDLAEWLEKSNGGSAIAKPINWRPSRTMRGLLLVDRDKLIPNAKEAKQTLSTLPKRRVKLNFKTPLALVVGLSGPWTLDGADDYRVSSIPVDFNATVIRTNVGPEFESWKNTSSRLLSELLAKKGIPTINFILTSRHHAFSSANKVTTAIITIDKEELPTIVKAWLGIADYELGVESVLRDLLCRGISVHTSSMLHLEQSASEWMYVNQHSKIMFATGTLAQGLNLPAIAVVIAGTSMGDPRESDNIEGVTRVNALIANAFGRASRPGFSNQGVAILVSDDPYSANISNIDPSIALKRYRVLGEPDALVEVRSPIEKFLDNYLASDDIILTSTPIELSLTSLLAEFEESDNHAGHILSRTFAAYKSRIDFNSQNIEKIRSKITKIKEEFLEQPDVPEWINKAAMKSGADFYYAWKVWNAYQKRGIITVEIAAQMNVVDWLSVFFETMSYLPPKYITRFLPGDELATETILTKMRDVIKPYVEIDSSDWEIPENWSSLWQKLKKLVLLFMEGASYAVIARVLLSIPPETSINNGRSSGASPIPAVFKFIKEVIEPLAIDAGCFLAINELGVFHEDKVPETLEALPLCIRNGCDSLDVLSWYRNVIRQRICAHAMNKVFQSGLEFDNNSERDFWVKSKRREWLLDESDIQEDELLKFTKAVIRNGIEI